MSAMSGSILSESYGSSRRRRFYRCSAPTGQSVHVTEQSEHLTSLSAFFREVFLPKGYPDSVSDDYIQYQIWDTVQAFASSITNTLATQAVLKGVGVGDEQATVLAATLTWLLKDGTGMLGRIMFTWLQGSYLDCDSKRWRLYADILNDLAIFMDICAPHSESFFTLIICTTGVLRSIVGVAGGATRAAVTQHQARRNNMADVSAKDGSQETLVNLAALLCNLCLVPLVTGRQWLVWSLYLIFTSLHIRANYKAVKSLSINTFNQARFHIAAEHFILSEYNSVPSVKACNREEPVFLSMKRPMHISLGTSLAAFKLDPLSLGATQCMLEKENYVIHSHVESGAICISLHREASVADIFKACYHAELIEHLYQKNTSLAGDYLTELAYKKANETFSSFITHCRKQGWNMDQEMLNAEEWRIDSLQCRDAQYK